MNDPVRIFKPEIHNIVNINIPIRYTHLDYNKGTMTTNLREIPISKDGQAKIHRITRKIEGCPIEEIFFAILDKDIEAFIDAQTTEINNCIDTIRALKIKLSTATSALAISRRVNEFYNSLGFWTNIKMWLHRQRVDFDLNKIVGKKTNSHAIYMKLVNKEMEK